MEPDAKMSGEFRLGISMSLGDTMLVRPIEHLRRDFPNLKIQVLVDESQSLIKKVEKRELDVVIILLIDGSPVPEGLLGEPLGRKPLGVLTSKDFSFRSTPRLVDLVDYPWVLNPPGCTARDELVRAYRQLGMPLRILVESSSLELKCALIEKGLGIGLARAANLAAFRNADRLRTFVPVDFQRKSSMWLVHSQNIGRLESPLACVRHTLKPPKQPIGELESNASARRMPETPLLP